MNESAEQPVERTAYVAPPVTLPMPAVVSTLPREEHAEPAVAAEPAVPVAAEPVVTVAVPAQASRPSTPAMLPATPNPVVPAVQPLPGPRSRQLVGVAALVLVLLLALGIGVGLGRTSSGGPDSTAAQGPASANAGATTTTRPQTPGAATATTVSTPPTTSPPTTSPPTTSPPGRPVTPEQAMALTDQQATDELNLEVTEAAPRVADLAGAWVPQVSSKCVGVSVDIAPDWIPDGVDDAAHVTVQQILAFHLGLHNRFGAVSLLPTQTGLPGNQATSGPCAGRTTWMSVTPERFTSAADANAWCWANVPPVRECAARYFAYPGERSTLTLRQ